MIRNLSAFSNPAINVGRRRTNQNLGNHIHKKNLVEDVFCDFIFKWWLTALFASRTQRKLENLIFVRAFHCWFKGFPIISPEFNFIFLWKLKFTFRAASSLSHFSFMNGFIHKFKNLLPTRIRKVVNFYGVLNTKQLAWWQFFLSDLWRLRAPTTRSLLLISCWLCLCMMVSDMSRRKRVPKEAPEFSL